MRFLGPRLGLLALICFGWAVSPGTVRGQETDPDLSLVDLLQSNFEQFRAGASPTAADSAALRRWTDSVAARGRSLIRQDPSRARGLLREALPARRALGDSTGVAELTGDVGVTHFYQSEYDAAVDRFEKALMIHRRIDNREGTATALNNVGLIRWQQGRYEAAVGRLKASRRIQRAIGNRRGVAAATNNIGLIRKNQGQYDEALARFRESLRIKREIGDREGVSNSLGNIGTVLVDLGRYAEALDRYRASLEIKRDMKDQGGIATSLGNIGNVYRHQGRYEEALAQYRAALRTGREIGDRQGVAVSLDNIGNVYEAQGQYEKALAQYRRALRLNRKIGRRLGAAQNLKNVGAALLRQGRLPAATDSLGRAVRLAETLRRHATSPEARRSLLSTQIGAYRALTTAHVRAGHPDSALAAAERARARLLADRLAGSAHGDTSTSPPSPAALRRALSPEDTALLYANVGTAWPLTVLVVTPDTTRARELSRAAWTAQLRTAHAEALRRLRNEKGPLTAALGPSRSSSGRARAAQRPSLAEVIRLYRYHLVRAAPPDSVQHDLARRLHELLLAPVAPDLRDEIDLTVVPTGALGYLPFETLRDASGQYLIEDTHVRYAQSLTVLRQLRRRDYPPRRHPLLAFGGAAYQPESAGDPAGVLAAARRGTTRVRSRGHASSLLRGAERQLEQGRSPRRVYRQLGYGRWPNLPGTEGEARGVGQVAGPGATVLTGRAASEEMVRAMSRSDRLRQYRRLHLATHGVAVPEAPALSALVLSLVGASDSTAARDGYLTMNEIADLEMRADAAVLSACQSGLGKVVAGEGVVSLSHAFLRAGANATLVSQWKVLDESTRRFMTAVYRRAQRRGRTFAEAVTETKRAFIAGEYGEANTDPLRWAPFVFYGRE